MAKTKIFCTSTGCIEYAPERYRNLGIEIIRIHLFFEGKEYLEGVNFDPVQFYAKLEALEDPKNNLPHTGMPTVEELRAHFDKLVADGYEEAIVFAISSGLGGTYNLISMVARDYQDRVKIHVVDTLTTCFNEGLLAIKAQQWVNEGIPTDQILKEVEWMKKHQQLIGVDGKLDYLIYNGRLKGGKAFMGQLLKICPVVHTNENGEIVALESVRTQKKALMRTCELTREYIGDRSPEDYVISHLYTGADFIKKLEEIEGNYGIQCNHEPVIMSPVSGCHNGPWVAGYCITFLRRPDEIL